MAAFEWASALSRTVLAAHVALKLMDRGRLGPANDVERHRLVGFAAKAFDFEIGIAAVEGVTEGRRGLRRPLESEHALAPRDAGEMIRNPARFRGLLRRMPDGCAIAWHASIPVRHARSAPRPNRAACSTWKAFLREWRAWLFLKNPIKLDELGPCVPGAAYNQPKRARQRHATYTVPTVSASPITMSRIAPRRTSRVMGLRAIHPRSACCGELTPFC